MITLGLNAAFHDSAAALVVDGATVAAADEERFSRIKHGKRPVPFSAWELPFAAIDFCLAQAGITLNEVDHIAYSFDPRYFLGEAAHYLENPEPPLLRPSPDQARWESRWDLLFAGYVERASRLLIDSVPHHLRRRFQVVGEPRFQWHFVNHHTCHQASAFLAAPFDRCAVMTLDGRGERASTTYGIYRNNSYLPMGEVMVPNSLGILYERVTSHLGFLNSSDEYKVMALAALGIPRFRDALREHIHVREDGQFVIEAIDFEKLVGPPRKTGTPLEEPHLDLAASLQDVLEETALQLAAWLRAATNERNLAMAGGVALNCLMNSRLRDSGLYDAVWVQPAAGDAGTALGAALWIDSIQRRGGEAPADLVPAEQGPVSLAPRHWQMDDVYLGPGFTDEEIEQFLQWAKLPYRRLDDVAEETARVLADDRIVGWFQGRMEWGPRALGARSILASPINPAMQARMNELKDREDFRPVAPAIPEEDLADWFLPADANGGTSPFMLFVYDVQPLKSDRIPSACHTDHTARVQTVSAETNPRFHALLRAFGRRTGVPVLINTSFNVRGQPIVCTPRDAVEAFFSTPLDALVIGSFLLEKTAIAAGGESNE